MKADFSNEVLFEISFWPLKSFILKSKFQSVALGQKVSIELLVGCASFFPKFWSKIKLKASKFCQQAKAKKHLLLNLKT